MDSNCESTTFTEAEEQPNGEVGDNSELEDAKLALEKALRAASTAKLALEDLKANIMSCKKIKEKLVNDIGEMVEIRQREQKAAEERKATALAVLAKARAKLHQCTIADSQPHAANGNSSFAEVEDNREEKAEYLNMESELRRQLASKQAELDALLHEKNTIWDQLLGTAARHDRELYASYEEHITQIVGLCERQRREHYRWFHKVHKTIRPGWLRAMVDNMMVECDRLRAKVESQGAAQLASAVQIRELHRRFFRLNVSGATLLKILNTDNPVEADKVIDEMICQKDKTNPPPAPPQWREAKSQSPQ